MTPENGSKGKIWYGLHFYPGVAEYAEPGSDPFRVFLNEDTIRSMDPTFAGRPVFVRHVNGVSEDLQELKKEADGWVVESFYNESDGKHWVKFITISEDADQAIASGWTLSNAYFQKKLGPGGLWSGVSYESQILAGEYEHLAIVPDPRYEESIILSPDDFKKYNEANFIELKRLANHKKGDFMSGLSFFKRAKVDNSKDLAEMLVILPNSKKEIAILDLIKNADDAEVKKDEPKMANGDHGVMVGEEKMKVNELAEKYLECMNELAALKGKKDEDDVDERDPEDMHMNEDDMDDDPAAQNDADDAAEKEKAKKNEKDKEDAEAKKRAEALRNAHKKNRSDNDLGAAPVILTSIEKVAMGRSRYGSR